VISADSTDPLIVALRDVVGTARTLGELRILARTGTDALLAEQHPAGRPTEDGFAPFDVWRFTHDDAGWHYAGNGSCRLRGFVDGRGAHPWWLDPAAPAPTPDSTALSILVLEDDCASGRPATGRIRDPQIVYRVDSVEIGITIDRAPGAQDCQSNPPTPYVVQLAEALGDRQLLDASREPVAPPVPAIAPPLVPTTGAR
jgi:hypothetical protein